VPRLGSRRARKSSEVGGWNPLQGLPRNIRARQRWTRGLLIGLLVGLLIGVFDVPRRFGFAESWPAVGPFAGAFDQFTLFDQLELNSFYNRLYVRDQFPSLRAKLDQRIVVVAIDDYSCATSDGWPGCEPVPRSYTATVIDKLRAAGATAIALDQAFEGDRPGSAQLAAAMKRFPKVVIAQRLTVNDISGSEVTTLIPLDPPIAAAARIGLADIACGQTLELVEVYPLFCGQPPLPTLAEALYDVIAGKPSKSATDPAIRLNFPGPPLGASIPYYSYRTLYNTPECTSHGYHVSCPDHPAADIWDILAGSIVLIGRSDQFAPDRFANPYGGGHPIPGVEVHAVALNTLLEDNSLILPSPLIGMLLAVAVALGMAALATALSLWLGVIVGLLGMAGYYMLSILLLSRLNLDLRVAAPEIAMAVSFLLVLGARFVLEERQKTRSRELLSRFVSTAVAGDLVDDLRDHAAGERRAIAVLFSDIRSFTTISENTEDPHLIMGALREYFGRMVPIVLEQGGTVDKFIGDGMMALFGAPTRIENPCLSALRAALAMVAVMPELNALLAERIGTDLRIGIGINFGDAIFGLSGAPSKLEFTAIGDAVNTAARLEPLTREKLCSIVISETVYRELPEDTRRMFRDLGPIQLKGKLNILRCYGIESTSVGGPSRASESESRIPPGAPVPATVTPQDEQASAAR
jgi:adenylate cyclase